ncbi:hypothetical protein FOVG_19915 [Fusarium oxysporum f. sp. pisi HDV247]|uniref:Uncharacterized protein n=1 Tax=Fusarium oxysporum f. sp. pisi HDV247 TaxID=1080344 RepID=W9NKR6_FUSOX|nr:hypothetical protein FOVG_19915 [Fusarium oxysporum f. sp. pisi HDV247]
MTASMEDSRTEPWLPWAGLLLEAGTQRLLISSVYVLIFVYHTRRTLPVYRASWHQERIFTLTLHILSGVIELARYYLRAIEGTVLPDIMDTILCFIHSLTTLRLARPLLRGNETTRAAYQAPAIIRPILAVMAIVRKDSSLHGAVVKLLHAFLYTRLLIFASKRIRLTKVQSQSTIYAQSVFLGAVLAIESSALPGAVAVYIGAVGLVMVMNRSVSNHLSRSREAVKSYSRLYQLLVESCLWIGLTELSSIKAHEPLALASCANDEYTDDKTAGGDKKDPQSRRSLKQD